MYLQVRMYRAYCMFGLYWQYCLDLPGLLVLNVLNTYGTCEKKYLCIEYDPIQMIQTSTLQYTPIRSCLNCLRIAPIKPGKRV